LTKHDYKGRMVGRTTEEISRLIDAYVHSGRDRAVIRLSLLEGESYTRIAGRLDLEVSSRTVQEIMNRWMPIILDHL
jgi:DNA-directed RNA polymerase specialized sigma24 family protein